MHGEIEFTSRSLLTDWARVAREAEDQLKRSLGLKEAGRLSGYRQWLDSFNDRFAKFRVDDIPIGELRYLAQVSAQLQLIARAVRAFADDQVLSSQLLILVKGDDLPRDPERGQPFNVAFELYLAERFKSAGYRVEFAEPDILVHDANPPFSIAAKRIWSSKQVEKRVSRAAAQIRDRGWPGFIALDLSEVFFELNGTPAVWSSKISAAGDQLLAAFEKDLHHYLPDRRRVNLLGVISFINAAIFVEHGSGFQSPSCCVSTRLSVVPTPIPDEVLRISERFGESFGQNMTVHRGL